MSGEEGAWEGKGDRVLRALGVEGEWMSVDKRNRGVKENEPVIMTMETENVCGRKRRLRRDECVGVRKGWVRERVQCVWVCVQRVNGLVFGVTLEVCHHG